MNILNFYSDFIKDIPKSLSPCPFVKCIILTMINLTPYTHTSDRERERPVEVFSKSMHFAC